MNITIFESHSMNLKVLRYQKDLEVLIKHADNPTPILYSQAVHVAVWSFFIFGTVSGNNHY